MPRGKRKPIFNFSPGESKAILDTLIRRGVVAAADVESARQAIDNERHELLARLEALGGIPSAASAAVGAVATFASNAAAAAVPAAKKAAKSIGEQIRKVRKAATPEVMAGRKLQGQYLGRIRKFPESKRGEFARIAKEKGRQAAIEAMDAASGTGQGNGSKKRGGAKKGRKKRAS